jgi:hypothetical protein
MTGSGEARAELTVGIVGPHDLVERIMLSSLGASSWPGPDPVPPRRMVAAAYRDEREAADKVARLGPVIDSWLFASPVPLEYARKAGVLQAPATCVPLGGSALYAALLLASRQGSLDLTRASIDVLSRAEAEEAYAELGLSPTDMHVRPGTVSAPDLTSFHERLWRDGRSSVAFTGLPSVAQRLAAAAIPVFVLRPTGAGIRAALRTAALLASNRRLEEAQLAIVAVEVPALRDSARRRLPRPAREELRLTVHRFLVQEAQQIRATVVPLGDQGFLLIATSGSLAAAGEFRAARFAARALAELGISIQAGIGTGRDAVGAEARARAALDRGPAAAGALAAGAAPDAAGSGEASGLPSPQSPQDAGPAEDDPGLVPVPRPAGRIRSLETLGRLAAQLPAAGASLVVDAETAGRLLGVTPRTARRLLHALAEDGLAWPLPTSRTPQPGRPRQAYRLLVEKLPHPTGR